jgi:hypothetical protein
MAHRRHRRRHLLTFDRRCRVALRIPAPLDTNSSQGSVGGVVCPMIGSSTVTDHSTFAESIVK